MTIDEGNVVKYLGHIIEEFQLNDLIRASIVASANFLCAVGCMNTIEFLGGLKNGRLGDSQPGAVRSRFEAGISLLPGDTYKKFDMYQLRNTLTHQYLAKLGGIQELYIVNDWSTSKAVDFDENRGKLQFNVAKLIDNLGMAWVQMRAELIDSKVERQRIAQLLDKLPRFM